MRLRSTVFWPPFFVLCIGIFASFVAPEAFKSISSKINLFILTQFGWLFSLIALTLLAVCAWALFSPFGKRIIGGPAAKPKLSNWQWFSVNLTTSVAIGILFWGSAEPLYHLAGPPAFTGLAPNSGRAATNAMATMFMHWTFIPYAIYAAPALLFAFVHYNMRQPFSLASTLVPLFGKGMLQRPRVRRLVGSLDPICLYALATGMAASLGTGVLTMAGGFEHMFGWKPSMLIYGLITLAIVVSYILSSMTGLEKGIAHLASISSWTIIALAAFVFIAGPTSFIMNFATEAFGDFLQTFFARALVTGAATGDTWPQSWTVFYWAVWMAWAPITAVFLGQIGYGRSVRAFIMMNLVLPALFSTMWMAIFSGTALHMEMMQHLGLAAAMAQGGGPEGAVFAMFSHLPLAKIIIPVFLATSFLSFVSGADANTTAMAGISEHGISPESPEPSRLVKFLWGFVVGAAAWIMVSFAGIDGVKMLSNLGGFPVLFIEIGVCIALGRIILAPQRYDLYPLEDGQAAAAGRTKLIGATAAGVPLIATDFDDVPERILPQFQDDSAAYADGSVE